MLTDTEIYERAYEEALRNNEQAIAEIEEFKKELQGVRQNLESNQKHLFQNVMVPITSQALMKGQLVHTNEVFVYLGDNWFVRTSADRAIQICDRKLERCNENLADIERQTKRFSSNIEKSHELEIFPPDGDVKDIIEPYDEEAEKLWRERHREKMREYKKKEKAERDLEDVFAKLEFLEKEENKLFELDTTVEKTSTISLFDSQEATVTAVFSEKHPTKRVSFSDSTENQDYSPVDITDLDSTNVIQFKHSANKSSSLLTNTQEIRSPADIGRHFFQNYYPKSILRNRTEDCDKNFDHSKVIPGSMITPINDIQNETVISNVSYHTIENVFGDITEKIPSELPKDDQPTRPMSKFKKSRSSMLNRI